VAVLDTNVLLRYLTRDNPDQSERALRLLQLVEIGERSLLLTEGVLIETVQVLSSKRLYDLPRETIQLRLSEVIRMPGVRLTNKGSYLRALALFAAVPRLSIIDATLIAHAQRESDKTVVSFDNDFRNLPDVIWAQP
jgi:predicted nucleic acid-binding protein